MNVAAESFLRAGGSPLEADNATCVSLVTSRLHIGDFSYDQGLPCAHGRYMFVSSFRAALVELLA